MGADLVVALARATGNGRALFGHTSHRPAGECQRLLRVPGRELTAGETVRLQYLTLPQVRQTYTVLGSQPAGCWGFTHGVNEHQVAVGCTSWSSRLTTVEPGPAGTDLTRLALERSRSACQALDVLTDLIARYGQGPPNSPPGEGDHVFLIVDGGTAFALEAAGKAWVTQEVQAVRAVSDVAVLRQDWDRIAPGLAERAIARGWWQADGSKLDFVGSLSTSPTGEASALRRWGRATWLLERQSGEIDIAYLRRVLADHYEGTRSGADPLRRPGEPVPLCRHGGGRGQLVTGAGLVAELSAEPGRPAVVWCCFGPPCLSVYFAVFPLAELPAAFSQDGTARAPRGVWRLQQQLRELAGQDADSGRAVRQRMAEMQAHFDQEAGDFLGEAQALAQAGRADELRRLAGLLQQGQVERFEDAAQDLLAASGRAEAPAATAEG
jgi:secernin